jgi:hypothetical protein
MPQRVQRREYHPGGRVHLVMENKKSDQLKERIGLFGKGLWEAYGATAESSSLR